jgi:glycerol dehydrogenase
MERVIAAPLKYVQGPGEMKNIAKYAKIFGKKGAFAISSPSMYERYAETIKESFGDFPIRIEKFNRECCNKEIDRLSAELKNTSADVVIGIGGGKTLDTAKAVAYYAGFPTIIVPTIASTDAPCSALSVIYTEDGQFQEYLMLPKNPDVVLVDSEIVSMAPVRLLVSGMGDALATYYEARTSDIRHCAVMAGGNGSITGMAIAKACRDTLFKDGLLAKLSCEKKLTSVALENIIEANTYLSGIGFESGGIAGAHAIHNGFTALEETHKMYHGEKVAFGLIAMMVLENDPMEEIMEVVNFCKSVGLPTKLADIGITEPTMEKILAVAKLAMAPGESIHSMNIVLTPERIASAIFVADKLGQ